MSFKAPNAEGYDQSIPIVSATPAAAGVDHNGILVGKWRVGIFGCCDSIIPNACMSVICPGISVAQVCARLGLANFYVVVSVFALLYVFAIIAAATKNQVMDTLTVIGCLLTALAVARLRWRIRFLFSIPGSGFEDCLYSYACGCCAIAQMATHVESYEPSVMSVVPNKATLQGYSFN